MRRKIRALSLSSKTLIGKQPLAYPVSSRDLQFAYFVSQWIVLKQSTGQFDTL